MEQGDDMNIKIEKNQFNTLFIYVDGALVADSSTMCSYHAAASRRRRGFWNKTTQECVMAQAFTPRNVAKKPGMVVEFLEMTGTSVPEGAEIQINY
jgi:hypothetical protein